MVYIYFEKTKTHYLVYIDWPEFMDMDGWEVIPRESIPILSHPVVGQDYPMWSNYANKAMSHGRILAVGTYEEMEDLFNSKLGTTPTEEELEPPSTIVPYELHVRKERTYKRKGQKRKRKQCTDPPRLLAIGRAPEDTFDTITPSRASTPTLEDHQSLAPPSVTSTSTVYCTQQSSTSTVQSSTVNSDQLYSSSVQHTTYSLSTFSSTYSQPVTSSDPLPTYSPSGILTSTFSQPRSSSVQHTTYSSSSTVSSTFNQPRVSSVQQPTFSSSATLTSNFSQPTASSTTTSLQQQPTYPSSPFSSTLPTAVNPADTSSRQCNLYYGIHPEHQISIDTLLCLRYQTNHAGHLATKLVERLFPEHFGPDNQRLQYNYFGRRGKKPLDADRLMVLRQYVLFFYPDMREAYMWRSCVVPYINRYLSRPIKPVVTDKQS